jgi:hypothetical protein
MFFTITAVESVVVDIDSFKNSASLFSSVLDFLQSQSYKLALVTKNDTTSLDTRGLPIFAPTSWTETTMFQSVIRRALLSIDAKTTTTVFLAADSAHLRNACELLLGTAVIETPNISEQEKIRVCQNFPDFIVSNVGSLETAFSGEMIGYGGEFYATRKPAVFHPSAVKTVRYPRIPSEEHPDCPVNIAGRYFGSDDPRHNLHPLSIRIVNSKRKPEIQGILFAQVLGQAIQSITSGQFDFITCVPPRPGKPNRLAHFLTPLPQTETFKDIAGVEDKIQCGLLKCLRDYPELKRLNKAAERKVALDGTFEATQNLTGKVVVLLDDIRTTGSTMDEAIRALKAVGVSKIIPIVLGYHPFPVDSIALTDQDEMHCKKTDCGKPLTARANSTSGEPFYGCSGWTPGSSGHTNINLTDAVLSKLASFASRVMQPDAELNAGDIDF